MRWKTRDRSFLEKMKSNATEDTIDITKPTTTTTSQDVGKSKSSSSNKSIESTKPAVGAGFLGALDKVKEPKFLSGRKEKRNNIKLNL